MQTTNGGQEAGLELLAAVSHKGHFDIDLPLTGPSGVEDLPVAPNNKFTVVMTFNNTSPRSGVRLRPAARQSNVIDRSDPHQVHVNLLTWRIAVTAQLVILTVTDAHDNDGNTCFRLC